MPSLPPLHLLLLMLLLFPFFASSAPVSLPLRRTPQSLHPDPLRRLAALASASALRASHLKNPRRHTSPLHPAVSAPLSPHSYGGYSFDLAIGTPPQKMSLLLDTGSHLNWMACTASYQCRRCASPSGTPIIPFIPKSSESASLVGCRNPRCLWIHRPDLLLSRCPACNATAADACPATACPPYALIYGSGSTAGLLMLETLRLRSLTATNFTVGCSIFSERQPAAGIAAFGRGPPSFPSQLGLKRFSYCLISRRYDDDAAERGFVFLDPPKEDSSDGLSSTSFLNNSAASEGSPFSFYYYVGLHEIAVGGKKVKVPPSALVPGPSGDGGAIIDSGTTFTYMATQVFEPVVAAFVHSSGRYNRSTALEDQTGLRPCFALPPNATDVEVPALAFRFKGGAVMRLPLENYFVIAGSDELAARLAIVSDLGGAASLSSDAGGGPEIILGNFQQQDYHVVYDLERGRLGFRRQSCLHS